MSAGKFGILTSSLTAKSQVLNLNTLFVKGFLLWHNGEDPAHITDHKMQVHSKH